MECGIFDFHKVFQGLLVRRKMGQGGVSMEARGVFTERRILLSFKSWASAEGGQMVG